MTSEALDIGAVRRWKRHPDYRSSGATWNPEVPKSWRVRRIKYLASLNPSKGEVNQLPEGTEVSFLPMDRIGGNGKLSLELRRSLGDVRQGFTYFRDGDVLVAKITPCFENGKGSRAAGLMNGIGFGTTELHVLRPKPVIDGRYLELVTRLHDFREMGVSEMTGAAGQQRVPESFIRNYAAPLPPLPEQLAISAFLDREAARIDELIGHKERLIALLEEKRQAVISHAVTRGLDPAAPLKDSGVAWTGMVPQHWTVASFKRATKRVVVGIAEAATHAYADVGVPIIRSTNVRPNDLLTNELLYIQPWFGEQNQSKYLLAGDLVTVRTGYPGVTAVVPKSLDRSQCFTLLISTLKSNHCPDYFSFVLNSASSRSYFEVEGWGSAQLNISVPILQYLPVPIPPTGEQESIVMYLRSRLCSVDAAINRIRDGIAHLHEYRTALISAAVTGQIDVRGEV